MKRFSVILTGNLLVLSLSSLVSCKSNMNSDLSLVNGALDKDKFPAVIQSVVKTAITTSVGKAESRATCTASIVSSRVVLTAAHCLVRRPESTKTGFKNSGANYFSNLNTNPSGYQQGQGPLINQGSQAQLPFMNTNSQETLADTASVNINGVDIDGGKPFIHDGYLASNGPDVGVIIFEEGVLKRAYENKEITKDGQEVTFEQIIMSIAGQKSVGRTNPNTKEGLSLYDDYTSDYSYTNDTQPEANQSSNSEIAVGTKVTIVGFGKTDQFDENSGGEKRYGTNQLTKVGSTLDFNGQTQSTTADGSNVFNSQGDSGGPMMAAEGKYAGLIVGVSSTQNQVSAGETEGEGHYANLTEPSVVSFIEKHLEGFSGGNLGYIPNESDFRNSGSTRNAQGSPNAQAGNANSTPNQGISNRSRNNGSGGECVCVR